MKGSYVETDSGFRRPVLRARFRNPRHQTKSIERSCILDTGMSGCGLPERLIQNKLKLKYPTRGLTEDADGKFTVRSAWIAHVELLDFKSRVLEKVCGTVKVFALGNNAHPIVGRNVLNQYVVTLNGPDLVCEVQ